MILSRFAALSVSLIPVSLFQWEEIGMEIHFFGGRRPPQPPPPPTVAPPPPPPPSHRVITCPAVAPIPNGQIQHTRSKDGHDGKSQLSFAAFCLLSQRGTARSDRPAMRS